MVIRVSNVVQNVQCQSTFDAALERQQELSRKMLFPIDVNFHFHS